MVDSLRKRQPIVLLLLASVLAPAALAQVSSQYFITTIAGGGPPNGLPSTSIGLSYTYGIAVDGTGNVYVAAQLQNRIYKASPNGTITTVAGNGMVGFSGDGGPAASAQLNSPGAVAVDSQGNLYIADTSNSRIRKVSPSGTITSIAGNGSYGFSGDNGPATDAQIGNVGSLAVTAAGIVYIADTGNYRIRKIEGGTITTIAGNGSNGYSGDNGLATSAQLSFVYGIAVDANGDVYFGDGSNFVVRKVAAGIITTVAGNGTFGFSGDNGLAISAQLGFVQGMAVDGSHNIYIADNSNRIRKVAGGTITTVAGGGAGCAQQTNFVGDGCSPTAAVLSSPYGVALDGTGNLYVADSANFRIRKIAAGVISTVAGNGSYQYSGDGGLAALAQINPTRVAVRGVGNYYISDGANYRVRNVTAGVITTAAGNGLCCTGPDNVPATSSSLSTNVGIGADAAGNLYTAEWSRVRKVSGGTINTIAGLVSNPGFSGDNGLAINAQLSTQTAVAADGSGNVYIADQANNRVRKVSGGVITTVAGGGPPNGVAATSISLGQPVGVATDSAGNVYIPSATDNRVYKIATNGTISTIAGSGASGFAGDNGPATAAQLNYPYGVAVNSAGTVIYIADRNNNRVRMVTGGNISTIAGGGAGCAQQTNSVGDGCPATSGLLSLPGKLAVDASGNLYIADALNYRVRKVAGGVITTVAGIGSCCTQDGLGDGGLATAAELNYAAALAIDPVNGDLYIGDSENFRVRKVSGGMITTVAGSGSYGYSGDNGTATSAQLSYSYGVAVDSSHNLYIADAANHRIRKVSGGIITTVAGNGTDGFSGDNATAISAQINDPYDVALDGAGNLYIADTRNNRIRKVSGGNITTIGGNGMLSFSGDGGQAASAQLNLPSAVAVDGGGNLYIADNGNFRIRRVSAGGTITTVVGDGTFQYSGDNVPATSPFGIAQGIAADSVGNLYLADGFNRIRRVSGGFITTIAGNGSYGFSGDGGPGTNAALGNPQGVAVDGAGNVYIADNGNGRIRLLTTALRVTTSISPSTVAAGTAGFTLTVNGSGFVAGDVVQWNGTALSTTFYNSGLLTAQVPAALIAALIIQPVTVAVSVNGLSNVQTFTIGPAPSCLYSFNPPGASVGFNSGGGTFTLTTSAGCPWTLDSSAVWLTTTSGDSGTGSTVVAYQYSLNGIGTPRSATITAGGQTFTLTQAGLPVAGSGMRFVPVTPCRIADTRDAAGPYGAPNLPAAAGRDFNIPGGPCAIPANALAYSLNLTVVPIGGLGFLSVWPAGQTQPVVSTLNSTDGRIKANAAIVPAGVNGSITLFASSPTNAIIDINGYFVLASGSLNLAFYPITPCRLADTRGTAGTFGAPSLAAGIGRNFPVLSGVCGIPATAKAYATNMTVVPNGPLGFITAWPAGSAQPGASTLNALTGAITANMAIVPAGTGGAISVIATNTTELIIDINGYFAAPGAGSLDFYTATPCRILDTRDATGTFGGPAMAAAVARSFPVPSSGCGIPATAAAFSVNATVVPPAPLGFLSLWGSGAQPVVSTLNDLDGTIVANAALVPAGAGGVVTAFTSHATHLILDINGYFQ